MSAPKTGRPITQPCGTAAAYKRHRRNGETPCAACRVAWATLNRDRYATRKANQ
jgi:hypothetical protein